MILLLPVSQSPKAFYIGDVRRSEKFENFANVSEVVAAYLASEVMR